VRSVVQRQHRHRQPSSLQRFEVKDVGEQQPRERQPRGRQQELVPETVGFGEEVPRRGPRRKRRVGWKAVRARHLEGVGHEP
jgi:hypothetical protein